MENLGQVKEVRLAQGVIRYRESGSGKPLVFVHGLLANGLLWRKVVPLLDKDFRCIVPDWPLGSQPWPMNRGADFTPPGLAKLMADFLEALGLKDVVLVGNDTGTALSQILAARHPERIGKLVLTNGDAYDNFLPWMFKYLQAGARMPGFVFLVSLAMRVRVLRRMPFAFGWLSRVPPDKEVSDAYMEPFARSSEVRGELRKLLSGISSRHTQEAAKRFSAFLKPVLIAWGLDDPFFPLSYAKRLERDFPHARLETIPDSKAFVPEDQPEKLAGLIREFA